MTTPLDRRRSRTPATQPYIRDVVALRRGALRRRGSTTGVGPSGKRGGTGGGFSESRPIKMSSRRGSTTRVGPSAARGVVLRTLSDTARPYQASLGLSLCLSDAARPPPLTPRATRFRASASSPLASPWRFRASASSPLACFCAARLRRGTGAAGGCVFRLAFGLASALLRSQTCFAAPAAQVCVALRIHVPHSRCQELPLLSPLPLPLLSPLPSPLPLTLPSSLLLPHLLPLPLPLPSSLLSPHLSPHLRLSLRLSCRLSSSPHLSSLLQALLRLSFSPRTHVPSAAAGAAARDKKKFQL